MNPMIKAIRSILIYNFVYAYLSKDSLPIQYKLHKGKLIFAE